MLTSDQIAELQRIAEAHTGHCDRCHRKIKIYRYRVNKQMVTVLKKMVAEVKANNENIVNFDNLDLPYRLGSQRTKMRLHGLIAKYKENGTHVPNTWVLTDKAGRFLRGEAIAEKVVVFDNQVIGHDGKLVTIDRVMDDADYDETPITTPEAEVYAQARTGFKGIKLIAQPRDLYDVELPHGGTVELVIDRLELGKPVKVLEPVERSYVDIAAFYRAWKIIKRKES